MKARFLHNRRFILCLWLVMAVLVLLFNVVAITALVSFFANSKLLAAVLVLIALLIMNGSLIYDAWREWNIHGKDIRRLIARQ